MEKQCDLCFELKDDKNMFKIEGFSVEMNSKVIKFTEILQKVSLIDESFSSEVICTECFEKIFNFYRLKIEIEEMKSKDQFKNWRSNIMNEVKNFISTASKPCSTKSFENGIFITSKEISKDFIPVEKISEEAEESCVILDCPGTQCYSNKKWIGKLSDKSENKGKWNCIICNKEYLFKRSIECHYERYHKINYLL